MGNSDCTRESPNYEESPVTEAVRGERIGPNMLLLSIALSTGLASNPHNPALITVILVIVSIGAAAIVNGLAFRSVCPRLSNALELAGIALMLLCFFLFLASQLPLRLAWLPVLCFFLTVLPTAVAAARSPPAEAPPLLYKVNAVPV